MNALVFCPAYDTNGKHDATGAFIPAAVEFCRLHEALTPIRFDSNQPLIVRKQRVLSRIAKQPPGATMLALFSHGWRDGVQLGFHSGETRELATALKLICAPEIVVALYCCDTGRDADADTKDDTTDALGGEGGFADALRNALGWAGIKASVYAHSSTGDTVRNPNVRVFRTGEIGGAPWLIGPHHPLWCEWRQALRSTSLALRFPLMTLAQIEAELSAPPLVA